jgi:hypothetical protein
MLTALGAGCAGSAPFGAIAVFTTGIVIEILLKTVPLNEKQRVRGATHPLLKPALRR